MRSIEELIESVRQEAVRADFPVDRPVYERAEKDPTQPILFAGSLDATVCIFGRDLGKDEVAVGEPLVGAGGRLVRAGLYESVHGEPPKKTDRHIESALGSALLTNTVPYKPPGNKAYSEVVKERFRPYVAELVAAHWKGQAVITLGTEAFRWFARYAEPGQADAIWSREDRYQAEMPCLIHASADGEDLARPIVVMPLPHPSPLNQRWYGVFPSLLLQRLSAIRS